ncbi:MAG: DUF4258 domain-containing protein [Bacteroidetes bacterium]|nr:DUF4258 domain-containing protein [Bacteroidota bacterium]
MGFIFSQHALDQMRERGITKETVENILAKPDQVKTHEEDLTVFQHLERIDKTVFLIRVFVNVRKSPNVVVTVYRTSKIAKYYEDKI